MPWRAFRTMISIIGISSKIRSTLRHQLQTGSPLRMCVRCHINVRLCRSPNFGVQVSESSYQLEMTLIKTKCQESCNLALVTYARNVIPSLSRWSDVFSAGDQLAQICGGYGSQGGAATVNSKDKASLKAKYSANSDQDALGKPALVVFLWQDGAYFEGILNRYMSIGFPTGIDPSAPESFVRQGVKNSTLSLYNVTDINMSSIDTS